MLNTVVFAFRLENGKGLGLLGLSRACGAG